ncbi:TMEM175 family protein [soil metagenome]
MAKKHIPLPINRLEAFSDGVIAIIITLMIFGIKLPEISESATGKEIWKSLLTLAPSLIAYALSFVMIGVLWVNHHQFFHQLKNIDRKLLWYNLHLLFWMCFIPIPTTFIGQHHEKPEATALYGFVMFMNAVSFALMRAYVHKNEDLLIDHLSQTMRKKLRKKLLMTVGLYFISIFAGYISVYIPLAIFLTIIVIYFMPQSVVIETKE